MRRTIRSLAAVVLCLAFIFCTGIPRASAQLGNIAKKAKEKVEKKAKEATEKDKGQEAKPEAKEGTEQKAPSEGGRSEAERLKPGEGVWLNYDFIPGDRTIFYDDFTRDPVGNFPQRLELSEGNMEVAEWGGSRWLRASTVGMVVVPLPEVLPDRFTLEFDYYAPWQWNSIEIYTRQPDDAPDRGAYTKVVFSAYEHKGGLRQYDNGKILAFGAMLEGADKNVVHCRVLADGKYMKVYANETRVANFPTTNFGRTKELCFSFVDTDAERPAMIGNLRIAAGEKRLYDSLAGAGRVATHGILFDTGSDVIRPESTPTLEEILQMLRDHPELKLGIEGHTDNVGDDASNVKLSERRANAVRAYLVGQGIEAGRLQAKGFGATKPASPNDTPEGRQNNRRVELAKIQAG